MVGKLNRLPLQTQKALVHGTSEEEVHSDLWEAVRLEFIVRLKGSYKFVHDRIQEAAYSLIPEELRAEAHLRIGRRLAAHTPPEKREEAIFEIVNQFNRGAALITSRAEREQLGVKLRCHNESQGIGALRAAAKREYHSSRLKETESALAQARNRSGREVPNTGWMFVGCLRSQANRMASAVVSWRWAYFCTKRAASFTFSG